MTDEELHDALLELAELRGQFEDARSDRRRDELRRRFDALVDSLPRPYASSYRGTISGDLVMH